MARRTATFKNPNVSTILAVGLVVCAIYFAQAVLIPIALAVLLSFLLAPEATRLERRGIPRIPSTLIVVAIAFTAIFIVAWAVGRQIVSFADQLPQYQQEIVRKVASVPRYGSDISQNVAHMVQQIESSIAPTDKVSLLSPESDQVIVPGATRAHPLYTVGVTEPSSRFRVILSYIGLMLGPLGTAGLVVVFVIFMLLEREDLRDRMIRVVSHGKYTVTTKALDDAARRISRYILAQSIINSCYGVTVAIGLCIIGTVFGDHRPFPNFILIGLLFALLRFVPYIGVWVASACPVAVALAVYPGYGVLISTVVLILAIELVVSNIAEPWLYGASTGLSKVAVLVAAVFWTWLWGPIGLLLSTPLTVCIVVLGRYVPQLKFLDVLLGDQPALPAGVQYYQRLLAGDREDAARVLKEYAALNGAERVADDVIIPALYRARRDRQSTGLAADAEAYIFDSTRQIVDSANLLTTRATAAQPASDGGSRRIAFGCASHHRAEELTLHMLGQLLAPTGCDLEIASTRLLPVEIEAQVRQLQPALIFIAVMPPGGLPQARYLCRRLHRRFASLPIVIGYWGHVRNFDRLLVRLRVSGASYVTTSLLQSRSQINALLTSASGSIDLVSPEPSLRPVPI